MLFVLVELHICNWRTSWRRIACNMKQWNVINDTIWTKIYFKMSRNNNDETLECIYNQRCPIRPNGRGTGGNEYTYWFWDCVNSLTCQWHVNSDVWTSAGSTAASASGPSQEKQGLYWRSCRETRRSSQAKPYSGAGVNNNNKRTLELHYRGKLTWPMMIEVENITSGSFQPIEHSNNDEIDWIYNNNMSNDAEIETKRSQWTDVALFFSRKLILL